MTLPTYSPSDVVISLAGMHTVTGYAGETFIKIIKTARPFEKSRAMNGEISRLYTEDSTYRLELTLMQSSPTNNILSMLYNIDSATRVGKFPLFIRDTRGQTTFLSATTWIEQLPDVTFSNGMEMRTWIFGCADASLNIGGNDATSAVEDALLIGTSLLPVISDYLP